MAAQDQPDSRPAHLSDLCRQESQPTNQPARRGMPLPAEPADDIEYADRNIQGTGNVELTYRQKELFPNLNLPVGSADDKLPPKLDVVELTAAIDSAATDKDLPF